MTEHAADRAWDSELDTRIQELVERIIRRATKVVEKTVRDTSRAEQRVQKAAEKVRRQAARAEERAARLNEKVQQRAEGGRTPYMKDDLRNLGLEIERQTLVAVEAALREVEQHLAEIDVEAITQRVQEHLADIDVETIGQHAEQALREASAHIQTAFERRGYRPGEGGASPTPEPVSEDERMAVLRMVQSGTISAEEAETLLDALEGSRR
ncbi:MAG: hypothetical protein ACE5HA_02015 [Anaerolineae bacterium]